MPRQCGCFQGTHYQETVTHETLKQLIKQDSHHWIQMRQLVYLVPKFRTLEFVEDEVKFLLHLYIKTYIWDLCWNPCDYFIHTDILYLYTPNWKTPPVYDQSFVSQRLEMRNIQISKLDLSTLDYSLKYRTVWQKTAFIIAALTMWNKL